MVEIFLSMNGSQISLLLIPRSDVERIAIFPFRWIRYVMFAICGARGDLLSTPDGPSVDYDSTEFSNTEYYYQPSDDFVFVEQQLEGLSDGISSTAFIPRGGKFRADVIRRDGACVASRMVSSYSEAAHLIPRSKGQEYIERVVQLRSPGDNSAPPSNVGINDMVNGILLSRNLHRLYSFGMIAFIKTPNYGLRPEDIRKLQRGDPRPDSITLHWLWKSEKIDHSSLKIVRSIQEKGQHVPDCLALPVGLNFDAVFSGEGPLPSTVVLDYMYGVAAYNCWRSNRGDIDNVLNNYRGEHHAHIPRPVLGFGPPDDIDETSPELEDPTGPDHNLSESQQKRHTSAKWRRDCMLKVMDEMNLLLMLLSGTTPEQVAERRQKEIEQEEWVVQEASQSKVMESREHMDVLY